MRKNQVKNREKRREQYRQKKPVAKINRRLKRMRRTVETCIGISVICGVLLAILFLMALFSCCSALWTTDEITFQRQYHKNVYGKIPTSYYVLVDDEGVKWRIYWDTDLDQTAFFSNVKEGDKLTVGWHYWMFGRSVKSLESGESVYRSMDEAKEIGRKGLTPFIIFMTILAVVLAIPLIILFRTLRKIKCLKEELTEQQKMATAES